MYTVISFFLTLLSGMVTTITASFCLTPKYPRARCLAIYTMILCLPVLGKTLCSNTWLSFASLLTQLSLLAFLLVCFREPLMTKFLLYFLLITIPSVPAEYLGLFLLEKFLGYPLEKMLDRSSLVFLLTISTCSVITTLLHIIFYLVWKSVTRRQAYALSQAYAVLPLIFLILLVFFSKSLLFSPTEGNTFFLLCLLLILIVGVLLFVYIAKQQEKNEAEAAYEEMTRLHALEAAEYQALEARSEELSRIRHDINHQLSTIDALLRAGNRPAARQFAREVLERLNDVENETLCQSSHQ